MNQLGVATLTVSVPTISRSDRWQANQRLQELSISCCCSPDGYLQVEITLPVHILQLRSVVQQLTATRADLLDGLERCWRLPDASSSNH